MIEKVELPIGTHVLIDGVPYVVTKRTDKLDEKGCKMCLNGFPFSERKFVSANIYICWSCYSCRNAEDDSICIIDDRQMIRIEGKYTYMEREQYGTDKKN